MGFRLVYRHVILNDLERRKQLFCIISPKSVALEADNVPVVEDRPMISAEYLFFILGQTDPCTLQLSLSVIAELLVTLYFFKLGPQCFTLPNPAQSILNKTQTISSST